MRPLRRAPAPLARNDHIVVAVAAQQDRLKNAALANRIGQLLESDFVELDPRLVGIAPDPRDLDLANAAAAPRLRLAAGARAASPSSAWRPIPRPLPGDRRSCRLRQLRQAADQLARQAHIRFRARALKIIDQRRKPVARRLGQPHVARNDRVEHRRAKAGADVLGDGLREIVAAVKHRQRDAQDRKLRVEGDADPLDRLQKLAKPSSAKNSHCSGTRR